jgi:hypothetical protein
MTYKFTIHTSRCPYCGEIISSGYDGPAEWGLKYGRCDECNGIYKTGKKLYSDLSPEQQKEDKDKFIHLMIVAILIHLVSFLVLYVAVSDLVVGIWFISFVVILAKTISYCKRTNQTLTKYRRLQRTDPELYWLEYAESMKIMNERK